MSRNKNQKAAFDWTDGELPSGDEAAWARFDYLKLRETLEAIVAAMEAAAQPIDSSESEPEQEPDNTIRLVVSNDQPEDAEVPPSEGPEKLSA